MKRCAERCAFQLYGTSLRSDLGQRNSQTAQYGIEGISNLGTKTYDLLPGEIKNRSSPSDFKTKIDPRKMSMQVLSDT